MTFRKIGRTAKFEELPLDELLQKAVREVGWRNPTPFRKSDTALLEGNDLMGNRADRHRKDRCIRASHPAEAHRVRQGPRAQMHARAALLPTRELAIQVADCFGKYSKYTGPSTACVFGGVSDVPQKRARSSAAWTSSSLPGGVSSTSSTSGSSRSRSSNTSCSTKRDRMSTWDSFTTSARSSPSSRPCARTFFFSATMPDDITKLASTILRPHPVRIEVAPQSKPIERINQELYRIDKRRRSALRALLLTRPEMSKVLVFSRTKHGANRISETPKRRTSRAPRSTATRARPAGGSPGNFADSSASSSRPTSRPAVSTSTT